MVIPSRLTYVVTGSRLLNKLNNRNIPKVIHEVEERKGFAALHWSRIEMLGFSLASVFLLWTVISLASDAFKLIS